MSSRLFVGVFLPDEWRERLLLIGENLRDAEPAWRDARWVPQDNLHVTLAFLGDVEHHVVGALRDHLSSVAARHAAHALRLDAVQARPSARRARMIWVAFADPEGRCASLAADVAAASEIIGSHTDNRSFKPHITLCRVRRPQPIRQQTLDAAPGSARETYPSLSVPSITLCESRLTPLGAVYSTQASWSLRDH